MIKKNADHYFLRGGGEMGELIRAKDWSKTALGEPSNWPQSLRTMVAVMLDNPFGMYIAWGSEYIQLYNDGYRPILGATKHPQALGISTRETFSEIWDNIIGSMFNEVMEGKAVGFPDLMLPLNRNGFVEECYFDFAYSPIRKDNGEVGGVLVTVIETTEKKRATEALKESNARFVNNIMQAPVAMCIFRGGNYVVEIANEQMLNLWGKHANQVISKPIFEGLPEAKDQGLEQLLDSVFTTGEKFIANERPVNLPRNGKVETTYINFVYEALKEPDATITGVVAIATDVTSQVLARKKIEESETRLQLITDALPVLIAYIDKNRIYRFNNKAYETWFGQASKDITGKHMQDVLGEAAYKNLKDNIDKALLGQPVHLEMLLPYKDGGAKWVVADYIPHFGKHNEVLGFYSVVNDVTTIKEAEKLNWKLAAIVQSSEDAIISKTLDGIITSWNPGAEKIFGYSDAEMIGKPIQIIIPPDRWEEEPSLLNQISNGENVNHFETKRLHKDGKLIDISLTVSPIRDNEGNISGASKIARDITNEKLQQQKIQESEERFRNVANSAPVLIWMSDTDKLCYFFNKGWLNYTGRTMEEELGNRWAEGVHPDDLEKCMDIYSSSFDKREPFYMEYRLKRHDGAYRWLSDNGVPRFTSDGEFEGYIGACMDIEEQKKAEERFRVLADQAPMWVWQTDKEVNVLYANPEVLRFIGIAHYTEFTGHIWEQIVHPEDIELVYKSFGEAVSLQQSFSFEFRVQNAITQQYEWFYLKGVPQWDGSEFAGFIGTGLNINEQKLMLSQLQYGKALLEAHNESSLDGILLVDTKGKILSFNHRFLEIWNMPEQLVDNEDDEAALAFAETQLVNPEQFMERVRWMYENPEEISIDELELIDGKIIERHGYHVAGQDGNYYGCSWMFRDITQQRKYERAVKESEEKFRLLADSMPQHIWTSDTKGNLNYYNKSVIDYSGLTLEQINRGGWMQIVHPDDREENIQKWFEAISTGNGFLFEHRFRRYDGEYRWQLSRAIPQLDADYNIQRWVGTSTDIQEQKTREEKKDEFISIASHEMKTPLTTAKAYLQMLELSLDENNEEASLYAKKANQSVDRLNALISELLDVSKIQLGKLNYTVTTFNFNEMIESVVENIQLTSQTHKIIKTGKVNDSVTGDKDRLEQVVINLLTNAIKYSPGAEKVSIHVEQEKDSITVSVKDVGIGIAQQSLDKIFEKYHRVEEHAVQFQGLGIGLFISYEIIQRHHGSLWAESELGKGSTFYFSIPIKSNF